MSERSARIRWWRRLSQDEKDRLGPVEREMIQTYLVEDWLHRRWAKPTAAERILALLSHGQPVAIADVVDETGLCISTCCATISDLRGTHTIERCQRDGTTYYQLKANAA